jgi:hypothetical protein
VQIAIVVAERRCHAEPPAAAEIENIAAGNGQFRTPVLAQAVIRVLCSRLDIGTLAAERAERLDIDGTTDGVAIHVRRQCLVDFQTVQHIRGNDIELQCPPRFRGCGAQAVDRG